MKPIFKELKNEVSHFVNWSNSVKHKVYEWEADYPDWSRVYTLIGKLLMSISFSDLTQEAKKDLLFLLARDNELEEIATQLAEYPDHIIPLSREGLSYPDSDARWQLAHYIWSYGNTFPEVEGILVEYYRDTDEYVRRRTLLALGYMKSCYAEQLALESWNTGLEYQRIAALDVLHEINSIQINELLNEGEKDQLETVRNRAKTIKERRGLSQ
ncbi:HEAT repeat domain-containing protein [Gorillibacterium massiliense]|uniref:HEAT repeat domain-containing protein n=1 Tax=Gorillibacterium massiliense TaxID=1280390 RepID=UPI0005942D1D|nr:hypothetical protein [Gorillibacterium massiliense]